jgi:GYF domain 2
MPPDKLAPTTVGNTLEPTPQVAGETKAQTRARLMAEEEARIEAAGAERWYYVQGGSQIGPVSLAEMRAQVSDLSILVPVKSVWTEGMENWKPVYEVKKLCEPSTAEPIKPANVPQVENVKVLTAEEIEAEAQKKIAADAAAAEIALAEIRAAHAAEQFRLAVEEVRLKAAEEARVADAERAMQEAQLDLPTEVTAAKKAELRATLKTKATRQALYDSIASTSTVATTVNDATVTISPPQPSPPPSLVEPEPQLKTPMKLQVETTSEPLATPPMKFPPAIPPFPQKTEVEAPPQVSSQIRAQVAARVQARLETLERESAKKAESEARTQARAKIAKRAIAAAKRQSKLEAKDKAAEELRVRKLAKAAEAATAGEFGPRKTQKIPKEFLTAAWFYTSEGARVGPVSFTELKELASQAALNPRLDLVWWEGMLAWLPAGQVEGLFTRDEPAKYIEPLAPTPIPTEQILPTPALNNVTWPGITRPLFIFGAIIFPILWYKATIIATPILIEEFKPALMSQILPFAPLVPLVFALIFGFSRLMNVGMSRWWGLATFIPLVNLWVGYRCFACPAGYAYVKKLDGPGVLLAILYWLLALATTLLVTAYIAMYSGIIKDPVQLKQLHSLLPLL